MALMLQNCLTLTMVLSYSLTLQETTYCRYMDSTRIEQLFLPVPTIVTLDDGTLKELCEEEEQQSRKVVKKSQGTLLCACKYYSIVIPQDQNYYLSENWKATYVRNLFRYFSLR